MIKNIFLRKKGIFVNKDSMVYITYSKYLKDKTKAIINEENVHKTNIKTLLLSKKTLISPSLFPI